MSKATDIYDSLVAKVDATLPAYIELPEAYEIEKNPSHLLKKGFAVGFLDEINENLQNCNLLNFARTFQVVLINKLSSTINDRDTRATLEKDLVDAGYDIIKALYNDITLGEVAVDTRYEGQSGIEYIVDDQGTERFISIALNILIRYQDTY